MTFEVELSKQLEELKKILIDCTLNKEPDINSLRQTKDFESKEYINLKNVLLKEVKSIVLEISNLKTIFFSFNKNFSDFKKSLKEEISFKDVFSSKSIKNKLDYPEEDLSKKVTSNSSKKDTSEEIKTKEGIAQDKYETENPLETISNNTKETNIFLKQILNLLNDSQKNKLTNSRDVQKNTESKTENGTIGDLLNSIGKNSMYTAAGSSKGPRRQGKPSQTLVRRGTTASQQIKKILRKSGNALTRPFRNIIQSKPVRAVSNKVKSLSNKILNTSPGKKASQFVRNKILKTRLKGNQLIRKISNSKTGQLISRPFKALGRKLTARRAAARRLASAVRRTGAPVTQIASTVSNTSKIAKIASGVKTIAGGVGNVVGGIALDYGAEKLKEKGKVKAGALAETGSYALTGAAIGSFIPIVGTAAGAAIGGAYGLFKNKEALFSKKTKPEDFSELMELKKQVDDKKISKEQAMSFAQKLSSSIEDESLKLDFLSAADDLFGKNLTSTVKDITREGIEDVKKGYQKAKNFTKRILSPVINLEDLESKKDLQKNNLSIAEESDTLGRIKKTSTIAAPSMILSSSDLFKNTPSNKADSSVSSSLTPRNNNNYLLSGINSRDRLSLNPSSSETSQNSIQNRSLESPGLSLNSIKPNLLFNAELTDVFENIKKEHNTRYKELASKTLDPNLEANKILQEKLTAVENKLSNMTQKMVTAIEENSGSSSIINSSGGGQNAVLTSGGESHLQKIVNSGRDPVFDYRLDLWNLRRQSPSYIRAMS